MNCSVPTIFNHSDKIMFYFVDIFALYNIILIYVFGRNRNLKNLIQVVS